MTIIDCHAHVFNGDHCPEEFLGIKLTIKQKCFHWLAQRLSWLIPSDHDLLERPASFLNHLSQTVEQNFLDLMKLYPPDAKVCLLLMDLRSMGDNIQADYYSQISTMVDLKNKFPNNILLFMHMNPNDTVITPIDRYNNYIKLGLFDGVKIYPSLNALPTRPEFDPLWAACERDQTPITAHCNIGGVKTPGFCNGMYGYNNPENWDAVLKKYPRLKLNLAHFANDNPIWQQHVIYLCYTYENVYTDIAYMIGYSEKIALLNVILNNYKNMIDKVLFGTDFFMVDLQEPHIGDKITELKTVIGPDLFKQISEVNPRQFLYGASVNKPTKPLPVA